MKYCNLLTFTLLMQIINSCGPSKAEKESFFSFDVGQMKTQCTTGENVAISVLNAKAKTVDSIVYYLNEQKVKSAKSINSFTLPIAAKKLGKCG